MEPYDVEEVVKKQMQRKKQMWTGWMTNHDANVKIMLYWLEYSDPKKRSKWEDAKRNEPQWPQEAGELVWCSKLNYYK